MCTEDQAIKQLQHTAFTTLWILTWEQLGDDLVLHNNMRNLGLDLDSFPGQLSKDLLTEENVLGSLQLHVPGLGAYHSGQGGWRDPEQR